MIYAILSWFFRGGESQSRLTRQNAAKQSSLEKVRCFIPAILKQRHTQPLRASLRISVKAHLTASRGIGERPFPFCGVAKCRGRIDDGVRIMIVDDLVTNMQGYSEVLMINKRNLMFMVVSTLLLMSAWGQPAQSPRRTIGARRSQRLANSRSAYIAKRQEMHTSTTNGVNWRWRYYVADGGIVLGGENTKISAIWNPVYAPRELVIPEAIDGMPVYGIGRNAFSGLSRMTSVTIPSSVTNIADWAFSGCSGLKTVLIPSSVTEIGIGAFSGCSGLTSVILPTSVRRISDSTFSRCKGLKSMSIPVSVTEICDSVFDGCSGLTTVTIPKEVTSIGNRAFAYCKGLGSIEIPSSVTSIGASAFEGCDGLTSMMLSSNVTNICRCAFSWCSNLKTISVDSSNPSYSSREGMLCSKDGSTLIVGVNGNVAIPTGVTVIADFAFSGCSGRTSVTIPSTLTNVSAISFFRCNALKSFSVDTSNPSFSARNGMLCSKDGSVLIAGVNGHVEIPGSVTSIVSSAFSCCGALKSMTITSNVTSVVKSSLEASVRRSRDLSSFHAPLSSRLSVHAAIYVDKGEFARIKRLLSACELDVSRLNFVERGTVETWQLSNAVTATLDMGTLTIGGMGMLPWHRHTGPRVEPKDFWHSKGDQIRTVVIGNGITSIDCDVFSCCSSLTTIVVDHDNPSYCSRDGILYDKSGKELIFLPKGVTGEVTIPSGVTRIGRGAFSYCRGLTAVTISEGVTNIGNAAFYCCYGLTSVEIPQSVTCIGDQSFSSCSRLMSLTVSEGVTSIGERAFEDCSGLKSVTIPVSVRRIGSFAFHGTPFYDNLPDGLVILGDRVLYRYKGECPSSLSIPSRVTSIGDSAFANCADLTLVRIPANVSSIGSCSFSGCRGLTSVTISEGVTNIGAQAFADCSGLMSMMIPCSVTNVNTWAFVGCTNLKTVAIVKDGNVETVSVDEFCKRWKLQLNHSFRVPVMRPTLGGSLRARRLQLQKEAASSKENAKPASQSEAEVEKTRRKTERAE